MIKAGCCAVAIGVESANPQVLKNTKKGLKIETVAKNVAKLRSLGFSVHGQFMIGNAGDTLETIRESIHFAQKVAFSSVAFYSALPIPSTGLAKYVEERGRLLEPNVADFDKVSPRVVFETDEFSRAERIEAIRLAQQAGFYDTGSKNTDISMFRRLVETTKSVLFRIRIGQTNLGAYFKYVVNFRRLRSRQLSVDGNYANLAD